MGLSGFLVCYSTRTFEKLKASARPGLHPFHIWPVKEMNIQKEQKPRALKAADAVRRGAVEGRKAYGPCTLS